MAITYPGTLDTFTNPNGTQTLDNPDHAGQHSDANDAIEALEAKVGVGAGTPTANKILVGSGNGTATWAQTWTSGTINSATLGTPSISSPTITGEYSNILTPEPASDTTANGLKATFTAGETLAFGNICYVKSDGKLWKADADGTATVPGVAIALGSIAADGTGSFILNGIIRNDAWTWTVGGYVYLSTSAGDLTQTAPSGTSDVIQIVGQATHADRLLFAPQFNYVEHI